MWCPESDVVLDCIDMVLDSLLTLFMRIQLSRLKKETVSKAPKWVFLNLYHCNAYYIAH